MSSNQGNTPYRDLLTASIYWIILVIFLYSYFQTRNPLSLSVATDRVVDALSISFIFLVNRIARKPADEYHSFGFHRVEVILNATVILLFVAMAIYSALMTTQLLLTNAIRSPASTVVSSIVAVPLILLAAFTMERDTKSNFRVMFIHNLQDLEVILVTLVFSLASVYFIGPSLSYIGSYAVILIILYGNRNMFRRNFNMLMEGSQVSVREVEDRIKKEFPNAHHLHIWDICQHQRVATLHLSVLPCTKIGELDKTNAAIKSLLSKYGVNHVTIQFESADPTKS